MADKMARADLPLRGGQSTKNAPDTAAGAGGAQQHQAGVAHTGQGVLRGRETGSQPTGGDVAPTWAHHHRQGAWRWYRRRPEHSVGWRCWLAGERGLTQTRRAAASPDRGDARARELPEGVRGAPSGDRPAAVTPHAALSRPERDRQPAAATWGDSSRALPGSCCSILRARWAAGTPHMPPRPGTTGTQRQHATWASALLGRLPRLPSTASPREPGWLLVAIDRSKTRSRLRRPRRGGGLKASLEAHARAPRCTARSTRAGRCAGCWRP